jgi:hypothetical protein
MASAAALASSAYIDPTDPRLNTPVDSYDPVTDDGHIAPRYEYLPERKKQSILELWKLGYFELGARIANCGRHGVIHRRCKKGNAARAHRVVCHKLFLCDFCSRSENLLHCWLQTRDPDLATLSQSGIEIIHARMEKESYAAVDKLAPKIAKRLRASSVRRPVITAARGYAYSVRMVVNLPHVTHNDILKLVRSLGGPQFSVRVFNDQNPRRVLRWLFESTDDVLKNACGHRRVIISNFWHGKRMMKATGDAYRPSQKFRDRHSEAPDEFAEVDNAEPSVVNRCDCGECDGQMEVIPMQERHMQPVEEIMDAYKGRVDWSSCYDPWRVSRKQPHTDNSMARYQILPSATVIAVSPPPG